MLVYVDGASYYIAGSFCPLSFGSALVAISSSLNGLPFGWSHVSNGFLKFRGASNRQFTHQMVTTPQYSFGS